MKRTKNDWLTDQPRDRQGISGLRFLDGEDLQYQTRQKALRDTQREWVEEQKRQNEARRNQEAYEDQCYAQ